LENENQKKIDSYVLVDKLTEYEKKINALNLENENLRNY
jgi:hypothetical protein